MRFDLPKYKHDQSEMLTMYCSDQNLFTKKIQQSLNFYQKRKEKQLQINIYLMFSQCKHKFIRATGMLWSPQGYVPFRAALWVRWSSVQSGQNGASVVHDNRYK